MTTDIPDFDISSVDTGLLQNRLPIPTEHLQEFTDNLTVLNLNIPSLNCNFTRFTSFLTQVSVNFKGYNNKGIISRLHFMSVSMFMYVSMI